MATLSGTTFYGCHHVQYSDNFNKRLVWYSDHNHASDCQTVCYSDHHLDSGKKRYSDYGHDLNTGYLNDSVIQKAGTIQTLNVNNDCCSVFMREPYPVQNKPH